MSKNDGGLRKVAFWSIAVIAVMYLVSGIFHLIKVDALASLADWIGWAAGVVSLAIVAILAWDFVRAKHQTVWTVLYIVLLLVAVVFVVLPRLF